MVDRATPARRLSSASRTSAEVDSGEWTCLVSILWIAMLSTLPVRDRREVPPPRPREPAPEPAPERADRRRDRLRDRARLPAADHAGGARGDPRLRGLGLAGGGPEQGGLRLPPALRLPAAGACAPGRARGRELDLVRRALRGRAGRHVPELRDRAGFPRGGVPRLRAQRRGTRRLPEPARRRDRGPRHRGELRLEGRRPRRAR